MNYSIPIDGVWSNDHHDPMFHNLNDSGLQLMLKDGGKRKKWAEWLYHEIEQYEKNPLSRFLAHGHPWSRTATKMAGGRVVFPKSDYPKSYGNDGVAFLNDYTNDIACMIGPNQQGKSVIGVAWAGFRLGPCEPDWPAFTQNHIEYREHTGDKVLAVYSYSWDNVATVWQRYMEFLPRAWLGPYSPHWGKYEGENGRQKTLNLKTGGTQYVNLECGGQIRFGSYIQAQYFHEGYSSDMLHADEQITSECFTGWQRSTTTRGDYTPACMTLTGHAVEGRPDTGMGGAVYQDVIVPAKKPITDPATGKKRPSGRCKFGTVGIYHLSVDSTPRAIISDKKKHALSQRWVDEKDDDGQEIVRTEKDERAAIARYWGGWEPGAGLAFGPDVWDREAHVIAPLWEGSPPPMYTLYRVIDYCAKKTTAVAFIAVGPLKLPNGSKIIAAFLYRLIYEQDMLVYKCAKKIIEASHNVMSEVDPDIDDETGETLRCYKELQTKEQYFTDLIDSRMGSQLMGNEMIIDQFRRYGLEDLVPASGAPNADQLPCLFSWMEIKQDLPHPFLKNEDGSPKMGCPRFFVFDGEADGFIDEVETVGMDDTGVGVIDKKMPHDAIDTCKYWSSETPGWMGSDKDAQEDNEPDDGGRMPETGY
jgi:hypothetical protein